jgi:GNAT superfamily N-acetyltransferase
MASPDLLIRPAGKADLPAVATIYAADQLGGHGDRWDEATRPAYEAAFDRLVAHGGQRLCVAERGGRVIGTFILAILPGLSGIGELHAELRAVHVAPGERSGGVGAAMVAEAERLARAAGAAGMELTSNLKRVDAHRFYERQGYLRSHAGFKKGF